MDRRGRLRLRHRWAKRYCVTVFVGGIRFHHPVRIGDLVEVEARLAYTGNTSMNISVEVRSGDMKAGELKTTTECLDRLRVGR